MVRLTTDYIKKISYKHSNKKSEEPSLKRITHLSLPDRSIDSIADISTVKNLSVLYLHHNNLQVIENLHRNDRLTYLYLQHNKINKMENLNKLKQLKKLYLGYNCISVVEGLDNICNLEVLHVESQQLPQGETIYFDPRTISSLSACLRVLDISGNNISSLSDLKALQHLERLDASNNAISELPTVCEVVNHWPRIRELDFRSNPVVRECKYRDKVIACTQHLKTLDGKDINDVTRSFIRRFESIKEERREKIRKDNAEQTPFSDEVASIAEHLPPGLRQSISASVKREAIPRSKSLTLSLMQIPLHSPGFLADESILPNNGLQARPLRKLSQAESLTRSRQRAERECHSNLPQLGDSIPDSLLSPS